MRSLRSLSRSERGLLLEAAWRLTVTQLALSAVPLRRLAPRPGGSVEAAAEAGPDQLLVAGRVCRAVRSAARNLPWQPVCLPQALVTQRMLRTRGVGSVLRLGVDTADALRAHAWVTVGPRVVIGGRTTRYTEVSAFPL